MKIFNKDNDVRKDADNESTVALVQTKKKHKKRNAIIIGACAILLLGAGAMIWRTPSFSGNSDAIKKAAKEMDKSNYTEAIGILSKEISVKKDDSDLYRNRAIAYLTRAEKEDKVFKNGDLSNAEKDAKKAAKLGDTTARAMLMKLRLLSRGKSKSSDAKEDEKTAARNAYADYCSENDISNSPTYAHVGIIDVNKDKVPDVLLLDSMSHSGLGYSGYTHIVSYRNGKLWEIPLTDSASKVYLDTPTAVYASKDGNTIMYNYYGKSSLEDGTVTNILFAYSFDKNSGFKQKDEEEITHQYGKNGDIEKYAKEVLGEDYYSMGHETKNPYYEIDSFVDSEEDYENTGVHTDAYYDYANFLESYGINIYDTDNKKYDDWKEAYLDFCSNEENMGLLGMDVQIAIEDLNDDGIPEIMMWNNNNNGDSSGRVAKIVTFANHRIQIFGENTHGATEDCMSKTTTGEIIFRSELNLQGISAAASPTAEYLVSVTPSGFLINEMAVDAVSDNEFERGGRLNWNDASNVEVQEKMKELDNRGAAIRWSKWIKNQDKNVFNYIKQNL